MDEVKAWQAEAVVVGQAAMWMETAEGAHVVVPWQQLETPLGVEVWCGDGK